MEKNYFEVYLSTVGIFGRDRKEKSHFIKLCDVEKDLSDQDKINTSILSKFKSYRKEKTLLKFINTKSDGYMKSTLLFDPENFTRSLE